MLSDEQLKEQQEQILILLLSTDREGMDQLIDEMIDSGFFTSPASTRFHGCYEGGLAKHSLGVYSLFRAFNDELQLDVPEDSAIIATLLHDLCKAGLYTGEYGAYKTNKGHPKGHAELSVRMAKEFIELTELEENMILYHMGPWNSRGYCQEYDVEELLIVWGKQDAVRWVYFCDEMATREEKIDERA